MVVLILSILLLLSYFFELTSVKTKIPTVILLIILGWLIKQGVLFLGISLPPIENTLQSIGTIGLILIVFEATLDLRYSHDKLNLFLKTILFSIVSILLFSFIFAFIFMYWKGISFFISFVNAVPFSIISSAIAIPSTRHYKKIKDFIIYDSTFSDIFGILIFNLVLNLNGNAFFKGTTVYALEILLLLFFSLVAAILLAVYIRKIKHHVKFIPILIFIIFFYELMKLLQLPGLIFVLIFGLFIANFEYIIRIHEKHFKRFGVVLEEIPKFKGIVSEFTFLVRSVFFLLLGYSISLSMDEIIASLPVVCIIVLLIFIVRYLSLLLFRINAFPSLFVAPRGLITIVLFFSIPVGLNMSIVNKNVIILIILITTLIMSLALYFSHSYPDKNDEHSIHSVDEDIGTDVS